MRLCWIWKQSPRTYQIQWFGHNQIPTQDFDIIQDWRRTTLTKHHTPAWLSSPPFNTRDFLKWTEHTLQFILINSCLHWVLNLGPLHCKQMTYPLCYSAPPTKQIVLNILLFTQIVIIYKMIVTPCFTSLAIRQSPRTKDTSPQHRYSPRIKS